MMPNYEFKHPKTGKIFEDIRTFSRADDPFVAPDGVVCVRCTVPSSFMFNMGEEKPDRYERKEVDHQKKVKDPERARRLRKKKFGTEGISITKSPYYHKEKRIKAKGTSSEVNRVDFVKNAAKNPNAVAAAQRILNQKSK